jgi:hypothetical protein
MNESKGTIISFMGISPSKPGEYWTINRHNCLNEPQVRITIHPNGSFETSCPCCGTNPTVLYEMGQFYFAANVIM